MANGHGGARPGSGRKPGKVAQAKLDIAGKASKHGVAALAVLVEVMKDSDAPAAARISAANALLDRGFGRPLQAVEMSGPEGGPIQTIDPSRMSTEALQELIEAMTYAPPDADA